MRFQVFNNSRTFYVALQDAGDKDAIPIASSPPLDVEWDQTWHDASSYTGSPDASQSQEWLPVYTDSPLQHSLVFRQPNTLTNLMTYVWNVTTDLSADADQDELAFTLNVTTDPTDGGKVNVQVSGGGRNPDASQNLIIMPTQVINETVGTPQAVSAWSFTRSEGVTINQATGLDISWILSVGDPNSWAWSPYGTVYDEGDCPEWTL